MFSPIQDRNLSRVRLVFGSSIFLAIVFPPIFQPAIDRIWSILCSSAIYHLSIWETLLTISSYAAIEVSDPTLPPRLPALTCPHPPFSQAFYTSLVIDTAQRFDRIDKRSSHAHLYRNGTVLIRPYARRLRELIDYAGPLLFLDLIMVKKFVGVPVDEIIQSGGYDFSSSPLSDVATDRNGSGVQGVRDTTTGVGIRQTWKVPTLHNFTLRDPVQLIRALPVQAPTSREVMLGVLGALVLYDFLFYLPHIAMHRFNWLWHLHLPHHQHAEIHPQITNQLSIAERLTLLLSANLSLHLLSAHPLTRTIFVPIFLYLLIENHSGLDLPYGYHRILPKGWAAGPAEHAEHHRHGKKNFQPYLTWADRLTGTHSIGRATTSDAVTDEDGGRPVELQ